MLDPFLQTDEQPATIKRLNEMKYIERINNEVFFHSINLMNKWNILYFPNMTSHISILNGGAIT